MSVQKQTKRIDLLIRRLKYLETPECRSLMTETDRVEERRLVTEAFRKALAMKNMVEYTLAEANLLTDFDLYN